MTTEGPVAERERGASGSPGAQPAEITRALTACDALLGEVGRRGHMFAWLRAPEQDGWLPVDAYYPGNRVVVMCRAEPQPHDELFRRDVPEHGLRLLELGARELDGTAQGRERIARLVGALGTRAAPAQPPSRLRSDPAAHGGAVSKHEGLTGSLLASLAPRAATAPVRSRRSSGPRAVSAEGGGALVGGGIFVGVVLALALFAESYGTVLALGASELLLAFGLALDVIARALGAVAAARARQVAWLWACVVLGSPAVATFVLHPGPEPLAEPAPLAGLLSLPALGVLALALVSRALGG